MPFHLIEPHPTASSPSNLYSSGRGGAGNHTHAHPSTLTRGTDACGPASRTPLPLAPSTTARTFAGIGGAGNVRRGGERAIFSFDEELAQQQREREGVAPVYYLGRGGAGNKVGVREVKTVGVRMGSVSSAGSGSSGGSGASAASSASAGKVGGLRDRLGRKFSGKGSGV